MQVLEQTEIDQLAQDSGVAVAFVEGARELGTSNNNSICRTLNPDGVFNDKCRIYCGAASGEVVKAGGAVSYTCHVGLDCRAMPIGPDRVAIVGRAFTSAEKYRAATEKAMTETWRRYPQAELFANVLLSSSEATIDAAARKIGSLGSAIPVQKAPEPPRASPLEEIKPIEETVPKETTQRREPSEWRSFFGSLISHDHAGARASMLEFISRHFGLRGLIWLDRVEGDLVGVESRGDLSRLKVKLGIPANDKRLAEAAHNEMPLELGENGTSDRKMQLFPVGIAGEVSAAVATLDVIESEKVKNQIARICLSVAPQFEILKLRGEMKRRERLSGAVRRIGDDIKNIDSDDFWMRLTQNTAEMLEAERASLLIYDEKAEEFDIKAIVGARTHFDPRLGAGDRVAKLVLDRGQAALVADVEDTGLPKPLEDRRYKRTSFLSCPVSIGERTIGVMSFTDRASGKPFDRASLELYDAIAPQLAVAVDRARLKEKAGEFEQLSVTDALTGLLNRRYIEQRLNEEVKRSNRHGFPMSFMMLDVDNFKSYNDEFGHPAGDEALKLVGEVIRDTLRAADVAARFGGEEFAILLPQTMPDEAAVIAERIRSNVANTEFRHRRVTLSIGVASCSAELCSSENIVSAADRSLYEAKRGGRNRVRTFEEMAASRPHG